MSPVASDQIAAKFPYANVLTEGYESQMTRIPESVEMVLERQREYYNTLAPRNYLQAFASNEIALMTLRIERCGRIERRERDRLSMRAHFHWDDDRKLEAEELGARLAKNPARVSLKLERTPHGCDWKIGRWTMLLEEINHLKKWTKTLRHCAFDLMGRPPEYRSAPLPDPTTLANTEIARLRILREKLAPADKMERSVAVADLTENAPSLRPLRRYETSLQKRLRWNFYLLQVKPPTHKPLPELAHLYEGVTSKQCDIMRDLR